MNPTKKTTKYRSVPTLIDDIRFDSKAEARFYGLLKLRIRAGEITGFDRQVPFPLIVNGHLVCHYKADFVLYKPDGSQEIIDVKGVQTPEFRLKRKLLKACYGHEIIIVN